MTRRILIECGAAETRSALLDDATVLGFWFGPARGDEHLPRAPRRGDLYAGRVRSVSKPLNGAFVDIGDAKEAFLPFRKEETLVEGARVIAIVRRPPLGGKGAVLSSDWKGNLGDTSALEAQAREATAPQALGSPVDAAVQALVAHNGGAASVLTNDPAAANVLRAYGAENVLIDGGPFKDAEDALDESLERIVPLDNGARMIIDESEAMTTVDIDAGAAADGATGKLNDKVNAAAAARLFLELARRGIGGRIVVDFLPPSGPAARHTLIEQLRASKRGVYDCRLGRLAADGLLDLTARRDGPSLLEHATEPAGANWPRAGRRFTLDWQAKAAIRALERALRAAPAARFRLIAGEGLGAYLSRYPQWMDRVAARFGARASVAADPSRKDRDFDIVEGR